MLCEQAALPLRQEQPLKSASRSLLCQSHVCPCNHK